MEVFKSIIDLKGVLSAESNKKKSVGFVPTMGALHEGHLSLVNQSVADNDLTVVSIFVNPTQFNNTADLEKYPRTLDEDLALLKKAKVDYVFVPSVEEIYPEKDTRVFDFGQLDKVMEGAFRPGHFNGVAQIVSKLFDIVKPNRAYFGEKDFQQLAIIRNLVSQFKIPVQIVGIPIKREETGLALSSRNKRLTREQQLIATNIYKELFESKNLIKELSVKQVLKRVVDRINEIEALEVEYFEIVDGLTLESIKDWNESDYIVGCITVYYDHNVRLIDNIVYKK